MKREMISRLGKIEASHGARDFGIRGFGADLMVVAFSVDGADLAILAYHVGGWRAGEEMAAAAARALGMETSELQRALGADKRAIGGQVAALLYKLVCVDLCKVGPDEASTMTLHEATAAYQEALQGRGDPALAGSGDSLDTLYSEIPAEMKTSAGLFPYYADYRL